MDDQNNNTTTSNSNWQNKVTYVDEWGHSSVGKPPEQEWQEKPTLRNKLRNKIFKKKDSTVQSVIDGFSIFQIIIVTLALITIIIDELCFRGYAILLFIILIIGGPLLIASFIIEAISILSVKHKNKKSQTASQATAPQKPQKLSFRLPIILVTMIAATIVAAITLPPLVKYHMMSDAFSREKSHLAESSYPITVQKEDATSGIMTIQLDQDTTFDFVCTINYFMGYNVQCRYEFADTGEKIGEHIFYKNIDQLNSLLDKYQDVLSRGNAKYIFKVKDETKMAAFFAELMQIDDYKKAYRAFQNLKSSRYFSHSVDYLYIENVTYQGKKYGGIELFRWADYKNFTP